jgi:hypothetical protein
MVRDALVQDVSLPVLHKVLEDAAMIALLLRKWMLKIERGHKAQRKQMRLEAASKSKVEGGRNLKSGGRSRRSSSRQQKVKGRKSVLSTRSSMMVGQADFRKSRRGSSRAKRASAFVSKSTKMIPFDSNLSTLQGTNLEIDALSGMYVYEVISKWFVIPELQDAALLVQV